MLSGNQTQSGHVDFLSLLCDFNQNWNLWYFVPKQHNIKFRGNLFSNFQNFIYVLLIFPENSQKMSKICWQSALYA